MVDRHHAPAGQHAGIHDHPGAGRQHRVPGRAGQIDPAMPRPVGVRRRVERPRHRRPPRQRPPPLPTPGGRHRTSRRAGRRTRRWSGSAGCGWFGCRGGWGSGRGGRCQGQAEEEAVPPRAAAGEQAVPPRARRERRAPPSAKGEVPVPPRTAAPVPPWASGEGPVLPRAAAGEGPVVPRASREGPVLPRAAVGEGAAQSHGATVGWGSWSWGGGMSGLWMKRGGVDRDSRCWPPEPYTRCAARHGGSTSRVLLPPVGRWRPPRSPGSGSTGDRDTGHQGGGHPVVATTEAASRGASKAGLEQARRRRRDGWPSSP